MAVLASSVEIVQLKGLSSLLHDERIGSNATAARLREASLRVFMGVSFYELFLSQLRLERDLWVEERGKLSRV